LRRKPVLGAIYLSSNITFPLALKATFRIY
jgi:hypothetical protein